MILGQGSGGHSQVLLGLLASLNQPQHPLCRQAIWDSAGGGCGCCRVSASRPSHSSKNTAPESHDPKAKKSGWGTSPTDSSSLRLPRPTLLFLELIGAS